jgi:hypothetical protein
MGRIVGATMEKRTLALVSATPDGARDGFEFLANQTAVAAPADGRRDISKRYD